MGIKIGALNYQVVEEHNPRSDDATPLWGDINYENGIIRIQENMTPDMQGLALLHESLHGIMQERGMNKYVDDEELIVPLTSGLMAFLKDNPELLKKMGIGG
ncbi:ImmA/IrrE family metallo-endopeptidase [Weissella tructae]